MLVRVENSELKVENFSVFERAAAALPRALRDTFNALPERDKSVAEEFRLRCGYPAAILLPEGEQAVSDTAVTPSDLRAVLEIATGASAHSAAESIRRGFVTARGGCRIGLCGTAVADSLGITGIKDLSSISIRLPREIKGSADNVLKELIPGFADTLIISPPGGGKTSLLRETVRKLSMSGLRVSLADERGEVAAVFDGIPQFDVGPHTDVLTGASKAESVMLLLRVMNPEVIALDEITAPEDVRAIISAANCGVRLLATVHAGGADDLRSRSLYRELLDSGIFRKYIIIRKKGSAREYMAGDFK